MLYNGFTSSKFAHLSGLPLSFMMPFYSAVVIYWGNKIFLVLYITCFLILSPNLLIWVPESLVMSFYSTVVIYWGNKIFVVLYISRFLILSANFLILSAW